MDIDVILMLQYEWEVMRLETEVSFVRMQKGIGWNVEEDLMFRPILRGLAFWVVIQHILFILSVLLCH